MQTKIIDNNIVGILSMNAYYQITVHCTPQLCTQGVDMYTTAFKTAMVTANGMNIQKLNVTDLDIYNLCTGSYCVKSEVFF